MTITLYTISDDSRQLVKEADNDHKLGELTAIFKGDVDILNPVLEIAYSASYAAANYLYISSLGRYYFINKITVSAQRMYLECSVDVLMTYAEEILDLDAIIARQEDKNEAQFYLSDGMFRILQPKDVVPLPFPEAFDSKGSFVLTVGGDI